MTATGLTSPGNRRSFGLAPCKGQREQRDGGSTGSKKKYNDSVCGEEDDAVEAAKPISGQILL